MNRVTMAIVQVKSAGVGRFRSAHRSVWRDPMIFWALGLGLLINLLPQPAFSQPPAQTAGQNTAKPLETFGTALSELIRPSLVDGQLKFEFPQMAEFNEVLNRHANYFRGGGSGQSGGRFWYALRNGPPLRLEVGNGNRNPFKQDDTDRFYYDVESEEDHADWISFFNHQDATRIQRVDIAQKQLLQVVTIGKQKTVVRWIKGNQAGVVSAASMLDAAQRDGERWQQHVVPLLEQAGIRLPAMAIKSELYDLALDCLTFDDVKQARLQPLLDSLNSASFAERVNASQELESQFETWQTGIVWALLNESVVGEVRSRLKKVLDEHQAEPEGMNALNFLSRNYWTDVAFWIELHARITDETNRQLVAQRLQKLSNLDFVSNFDAAKQQWTAQQPAPTPAAAPAISVAAPRSLEKVKPMLSDLLVLTLEDQRLAIDRPSWRRRFGDREVAEVLAAAEAVIRDNHLPPRWLTIGNGTPANMLDHSHLLFEHLEHALINQLDAQQQNYLFSRNQQMGRVERERRFDVNDVKAALLFFKNQGEIPGDQLKTVQLRIEEQHPLGVQIAMDQHHNGQFFLSVADPHLDQHLVIWQSNEGPVLLHWFQADQHVVAEAASWPAIVAAHPQLFADTIWPFLSAQNFQLNSALTGSAPSTADQTTAYRNQD